MLLFFIYCKDIKIISYVQNQILAHILIVHLCGKFNVCVALDEFLH